MERRRNVRVEKKRTRKLRVIWRRKESKSRGRHVRVRLENLNLNLISEKIKKVGWENSGREFGRWTNLVAEDAGDPQTPGTFW